MTWAVHLPALRTKATERRYRYVPADGAAEVCETIDGVVARMRAWAVEDGHDPDDAEMTWRSAALVVEGDLQQPVEALPGSPAAVLLPYVEWLMSAAGLEWLTEDAGDNNRLTL